MQPSLQTRQNVLLTNQNREEINMAKKIIIRKKEIINDNYT